MQRRPRRRPRPPPCPRRRTRAERAPTVVPALLPYQLRLVTRGLRRAPGLSLAILVGLALAGAIWTAMSAHYLRFYGARPPLSPALHQVELPHATTVSKAFNGASNGESQGWASRTRL